MPFAKNKKYEKNCMAIDFAKDAEKKKLQKKFGIISLSPFWKISNFDIFQQTTVDIMHVLLEGMFSVCLDNLYYFNFN